MQAVGKVIQNMLLGLVWVLGVIGAGFFLGKLLCWLIFMAAPLYMFNPSNPINCVCCGLCAGLIGYACWSIGDAIHGS
jgi:hypothetical protein